MIPEKLKSIINSCETFEQLDTCGQWVEYTLNNEAQATAKAVIQQKRNQIELVMAKFSPDHIKHVQSLEH